MRFIIKHQKGSRLTEKTSRFLLIMVLLVNVSGIIGCSQLFGDPNKLYVLIKTKPESCKVVLRSLNTSEISSYTSPVELGYHFSPFMASYVEVSKEGYKTEKIKLDPDKSELFVELQLLTEEEMLELKAQEAKSASMGPGSHGEIGGGSAESLVKEPSDSDMPNLGTGMGGFGEAAF